MWGAIVQTGVVSIYVLKHPLTGEIRYVGKTKNKLSKRRREHIDAAKASRKQHVSCWIRSLLGEGLQPDIELQEIADYDTWPERETHWVSYHKSAGARLTNHTSGGDGAPGCTHSQETRDKLSKMFKGIRKSKEHREKVKKTIVALYNNPEYKKRIGDRIREARKNNPEWGPNISKALKGKKPSDETRKKLSEARRRLGPLPQEVKDKIRKAHIGMKHTDASKAKISATKLANPISSDARARIAASNKNRIGSKHTEESKKKMSEALKRAWARRKGLDR